MEINWLQRICCFYGYRPKPYHKVDKFNQRVIFYHSEFVFQSCNMSLRTLLNREHTHFLVQYHIDQTMQVRSRGFIKHIGEIEVGACYDVKHGIRSSDIAKATILGAGIDDEMQELLEEKEIEDMTPPTSPTEVPVVPIEVNIQVANNPTQPAKRQKTATATTKKAVMKKKASVIRRSQLPASVVQHQALTTDQHASEELSEISSVITSQPAVSSNPFINFSQLTTSHLDQQQTTNPFTSTSQISQQSNPFVTTSHQSVSAFNPFINTSQPSNSSNPFASLNQSTSSPATTNPFETTDFPIVQSTNSPSVVSHQTFNYPEPITPTCSTPMTFDTPERPLHRRPIQDRKLDGIFQRLSTLEKNQTDIKNNQQVIMTMLSTTIQLLQGNSTSTCSPTNQSSIYTCQPVNTNSEAYPFYDVPEIHRINMIDLNYMSKHSNCPGHLATKLVDRLFPELFTTEQLRLQYSYHGGGKCNKSELPHDRKCIMQRYILHFYPSLSDPRVWKDAIVPRINEYLRRPSKQSV